MAKFLLEASSALVKPHLYDPRLAILSDRGVREIGRGIKSSPDQSKLRPAAETSIIDIH